MGNENALGRDYLQLDANSRNRLLMADLKTHHTGPISFSNMVAFTQSQHARQVPFASHYADIITVCYSREFG